MIRTELLPLSAIHTSPSYPTLTPLGRLRRALEVAGPSSQPHDLRTRPYGVKNITRANRRSRLTSPPTNPPFLSQRGAATSEGAQLTSRRECMRARMSKTSAPSPPRALLAHRTLRLSRSHMLKSRRECNQLTRGSNTKEPPAEPVRSSAEIHSARLRAKQTSVRAAANQEQHESPPYPPLKTT